VGLRPSGAKTDRGTGKGVGGEGGEGHRGPFDRYARGVIVASIRAVPGSVTEHATPTRTLLPPRFLSPFLPAHNGTKIRDKTAFPRPSGILDACEKVSLEEGTRGGYERHVELKDR